LYILFILKKLFLYYLSCILLKILYIPCPFAKNYLIFRHPKRTASCKIKSMKNALSKKYDVRAPRYTSYPTAPHFTDTINGETYRGWLESLSPYSEDGSPGPGLSLYFHIPFCDQMCWFCGCYTKIVNRYQPIRDYLDVLLAEIDLVAKALPERFSARHLHWGGGSPTMLRGEDWLLVMDRLRTHFDISEEAEIAVELDPRDATEDYVKALSKAGVNRASIGVQDFDPKVQEAINRIQPFEVTKRVIDWLRKHAIDHLNVDLMYGLPHQTTEMVLDQTEKIAALAPSRIALFGYAHVPWMKTHQKMIDEDALPDADERLEQFNAASKRLEELGYIPIGLDHFAHPKDSLAKALEKGRLHRNFQGYTVDEAPMLLGFGASAIGRLPQGHLQNTLPLKAYREAIMDGRFATARGLAFTGDDRIRGDVIERLMCDLAVDIKAIRQRHHLAEDAFADEMSRLAPFLEDGIITLENDRITVTETGRPFVRLIAAIFDSYLQESEKKYSKAV
jgi:oxygen-independent coproporphyrinogen III oxidase